MARYIVNDSEVWKGHGRRGRRTYEWEQWLDGLTYELTQGEDFHIAPAVFAAQAYTAAQRLGVRDVRTRVIGDKVYIQAFSLTPPEVEFTADSQEDPGIL